ncbi:MAG TPA: oligosaccharide flippase family protein [Kofleriaceae bacterium]
MSDAKEASKEAGIYAYSRIAASLFALLALALGARLYSKPEFEYIAALLLLCESAVALGSLGLADAVFYYIGREPERASHVVRQTSLLLLLVAVPVSAIVVGFGLTMSEDIPIGPALPWIALAIIIELPTQPAVNQLLAVRQARLASLLYITFAAFRPLAVLLPVLVGIDLAWMPIIIALTSITRLAAHTAIVRRVFPLSTGGWFDKRILWSIVLFAFPAGVAVLGGKLNPQIDKYVVQWVRGNEDFVLYTMAAWELPLITLIPYAIGAVMQARYARLFANGEKEQLRQLWLNTVRKTSLLVLPLALMFIALAREAIVLVAGERYADAAPLFQIFTLTMLQRVTAYGPMLQSIGETRSLLVTSSLLLMTNLALSYPFTIWFGFTGAAIATVCATIPPLMFTLWRISLGFGCTIRGVMPWRHYFATLALSSVVALGVWLLRDYLPPSAGARLGIGAAIYIVTFFAIGRAVRLISAEDSDYIKRWLTLDMLRR